MEDEGDRSAREIKNLLQKLSPKLQHKDRVRSLQRFRNYTSGDQSKTKNSSPDDFSTPEFYDDDIPLLLLGSHVIHTTSQDVLLREEEIANYTGVLTACAMPSGGGKGLKRSCQNAMNLLKYLVLEYVEISGGEPVAVNVDAASGLPELNPFAYALCCLPVGQLRIANWETHLLLGDNDKRGGAKSDACEILLLILTRHFDPISDNATVLSNVGRAPAVLINIDELMPDAKARQSFDNWLVMHKSRDVVSHIRDNFLNKGKSATSKPRPSVPSNTTTTPTRMNNQQPLLTKSPFGETDSNDGEEVELDAFARRRKSGPTLEEKNAIAEAEKHAEQQLDRLGLDLYDKQKLMEAEAGGGAGGPPTTWRDSQLNTLDALNGHGAAGDESGGGGEDDDMRSIKENTANNEEKLKTLSLEREKIMARDPLGIRPDGFDLKMIQGRVVELLEVAINDLDEEITETSGVGANQGGSAKKKKKDRRNQGYNLDQLVSLEAQRDSLQAILEGRQLGVAANNYNKEGEDGEEGDGEDKRRIAPPTSVEELSILPTDPNFNPLLFLTLVHRDASFEQLKASMRCLNHTTENQAARLQSLVRDNFALFIRCADGIDLFSEKANSRNSSTSADTGVNARLDRIDSIANSCTEQSKKSFKPLLDNTTEVRKVQSAIAVLQRVGPLLQVPSLMRQHIENGRFSAAVKAYRTVLVIDDHNKIELLRHVKRKASEAARDARRDLECRLANPTVPVQSMLDSLRDLEELIELDIPLGDNDDNGDGGDEDEDGPELAVGVTSPSVGKFKVGKVMVDVREYPPCLACLLLQAAHFSLLVQEAISEINDSCYCTYAGEALPVVSEGIQQLDPYGVPIEPDEKTSSITRSSNNSTGSENRSTTESNTSGTTSDKRERNRWKYEVLEQRVVGTIRVVKIARTWLPRLIRIAEAARQAERRRAVRHSAPIVNDLNGGGDLTAFEVFITKISPSMRLLVEHGAFCSLGCYNDVVDESGKCDLTLTFGGDTDARLQSMLRSPLPEVQSTKCATELAELADFVQTVSSSAIDLRPNEEDIDGGIGGDYGGKSSYYFISMESTLEEISSLVEKAVVTIERRKCIYAFDFCGKTCSMRAAGGGVFDGEAILACVQKLADELTRPEACASEIENGCALVVNKCCDGLDSYVNDRGRDRGDSARLRIVAECATALDGSIEDVVSQTAFLTNEGCELLEDSLVKRVMDLEAAMFDEFLESIRLKISTYTRLGPMILDDDDYDRDQYVVVEKSTPNKTKPIEPTFPAYLSASLLAIVRCRAQVERTLGEKTIRKCEDIPYQFLAMSTAADSVVDGICFEMDQRMAQMRGTQADVYLNELQFLINTLRKYLSKDLLGVAEHCRENLLSKAGAGFQGDGPDGLGAIEHLERLGRVYVLCLGV